MAKKKIQNFQEGTPAPKSLEALYLGDKNDASIASTIEPEETDDFSIVTPNDEKYDVAIKRKRQKAAQTEFAVALTENRLGIPVVDPAIKEAREHAEQTKKAVLDVEAAELKRYDGNGFYDEQSPENRAMAAKLQAQLVDTLKKEQELLHSPEFRSFESVIGNLDEQWKQATSTLQNKIFFVDLFDSLRPVSDKLAAQLKQMYGEQQEAVSRVVEQYSQIQEKLDLFFVDLFKSPGKDENGNDIEPFFFQALRKMRQQAGIEADKEITEIESLIIKNTDILDYPLDKPNRNIWNLLNAKQPGGQIGIAFNVANAIDKAKKKAVDVIYSINFDKLKNLDISTELTLFDKYVYMACSALYNAGNECFTATQIYYMMGGKDSAPSSEINKIMKSIEKMQLAFITISNEDASKQYNYERFDYKGYLLPMEFVTRKVNGKITNAVIHMFREPPMITFSRSQKQITTIPVKMLQAPVNKSKYNLPIMDYLIERVKQKNPQPRILFDTLFQHAGIDPAAKDSKTKKAKTRAKETAETIMQYFKERGYIKNFTADNKGIIFEK